MTQKAKLGALILVSSMMGIMGNCMAQAVSEFKLANGLKIVVQEDHRAPVVVSQIWYKVGSADEVRGITGLSHALEHMMFRGTPSFPKDSYSEIISANGGRDNAFTSTDYTGYYAELDKSKLELSFELEADRMRMLSLDPQVFQTELKAVREERRLRTEDNPRALTYERFAAVAYPNGPYHHPIIGWMDDIQNYTITDLRHWYENWYVPNNATIVVVGDVDPQQVLALATKYFGPIPAKPMPPVKPLSEITPLGEQRIRVEIPAELPYLMMGYKVPSYRTAKEEWEPYALAVAAAALDGGNSARFAKNIIRGKTLAASAGASYDFAKRFDSQFLLRGIPAGNHTMVELEAAFRDEVAKLRNEPLPDAELARIKTLIMASDVFDKDSMSDQALVLGEFESVGGSWKDAKTYVDKIKAVTSNQVQAVAQKYLVDGRLTVAELIPQSTQKPVANKKS